MRLLKVSFRIERLAVWGLRLTGCSFREHRPRIVYLLRIARKARSGRGRHAFGRRLHLLRQGIIGHIHIGEERIAAFGGVR